MVGPLLFQDKYQMIDKEFYRDIIKNYMKEVLSALNK